jgi:transposase
MTKKDLNNWIMYHEINRLGRQGFSSTRIARYLVMDRRTVKKYLAMTEQEYELYLLACDQRSKILASYELFVVQRLTEFQDTSTAQIHDWLKEHHPDFPQISTRTVYNFVMFVRQAHNLPFVKPLREYFPVGELPYGEQAQVDFGEYNLRLTDGKRKKVYFFAIVLSRSRMKFIWFLDKPFTAQTVCQAHEQAFAFFGGIPGTLVYDQDRTMVVDENLGDVILTSTFKQYTKSRNFLLHFCRKADPESKGKIENVIQYVKKNFLYNRLYSDLETLNTQALAWLGRTANFLPHNFTKKSPIDEYIIEKQYLNTYTPLILENMEYKTYNVRKVNTISYKSNFYELPMGTYQGIGTQVLIKEKDNILEIYSLNQSFICTYPVSSLKGQTITNSNHKRDTSRSLDEMINQTGNYFTNKELALNYVQRIRELLPRYTRDHLQVIIKALTKADQVSADKALDFCLKNDLINGYEFEQVLHVHLAETELSFPKTEIKLLDKNNLVKAGQIPQSSDIQVYENIINQ